MNYEYYSPTYNVYVTSDNKIFTGEGRQVNISQNTETPCIRTRGAERVSIYTLNKDLIRLDGKVPFKRPFCNVRKKELLSYPDCIRYIGQLHEQGMSNQDLAIAFGCNKETISKKIFIYLSGILDEETVSL